jgi:hypothetical protein
MDPVVFIIVAAVAVAVGVMYLHCREAKYCKR